jgi:Zn-dependent membrane protease YugP
VSEFDISGSETDGFASAGASPHYELTGPPIALPTVSLVLALAALVLTVISGDSVVAFSLATLSCLLTLGSRAMNQLRMNKPSYSSAKWFSAATTWLYVSASLLALAQVLMVAYVAGQ